MDLKITLEGDGAARTVRLEGCCDLSTAPELRETLRPLGPPGVTHVVLDVSALEFLDSTGLGVLLGALRRLREGGGELRLLGATGPVRRVLDITGLDKIIPLA